MSEEADPLDVLCEAVQTFANSLTEQPELLDNALVIWEAVSFNEDGETQRCIRYAVPTPNFTMSGTLGLLRAGEHYIRRDVFYLDNTDDDE